MVQTYIYVLFKLIISKKEVPNHKMQSNKLVTGLSPETFYQNITLHNIIIALTREG